MQELPPCLWSPSQWVVCARVCMVEMICFSCFTLTQDVGELLEKRVKSRFSHRQIQLFPQFSFEDYLEIFQSLISLPAHTGEKFVRDWNDCVKVGCAQNFRFITNIQQLFNFSNKNIKWISASVFTPHQTNEIIWVKYRFCDFQ